MNKVFKLKSSDNIGINISSCLKFYKIGGAAHIAGVQLNTIKNNPDGTFCLNEFESKIRGSDFHEPITKLCVIENTHNMCGGKVTSF